MYKAKSTGMFFAFLLIFVGGVWLWTFPLSYAQEGGVFTSPLATPTVLEGNNPFGSFPSPSTPTPIPSPSAVGQRALQYVADRNKISVTDLIVVSEHTRDYPLTGQSFQAVTLLDRKTNRVFKLLVDPEGKTVLEDVTAVEQTERDAHQVKYGRMEPRLYEQLQTMKDDEMVDVAIWMVGVSKRSREEHYADLAAAYPEAEEALNRSGKPMDVGDYDLINKMEAEYVKLLNEDTQGQIQPLARYLEERGYKVITFEALPVIAVTLPKQVIQEIGLRDDVDAIYLDDEKEILLLDTASSSNRIPSVWQSGFEGNGIVIGIVEGGNVDFTGPVVGGHNYLHQGTIRSGCTTWDSWHKTMVASSAASYSSTLMGMAPEATIVDACTDGTSTDTITGLAWATNRADPINRSAVFNYNADMDWTDRAFDYWAHTGNDTIVVAAGNDPNGYIGSPAKGWNVITVGGSNDNNSSNWSDDSMYPNSTWKNPTGYNREKPEVVAPAVSVTAIELNNNPRTENGTSLAAPQVAGLAALLMDRNADLAAWPEAVKAIIMASAVHNITGPANGLAPGQDLKDGAGAIDAALADTIAKTRQTSATTPCTGPCWWGISINNTNFPLLTWLYRGFTASRGERIRVVISWWSNADCPDQNNCDYDRLDTDLDLHILDPDGQTVVS